MKTIGTFNRDRRPSGGRNFGRRDFGGRGGGGGRDFNRGSENREMFKTVCSNCGKECEVPFRPTSGKPVYCSDCFEKMRDTRPGSPRPERPSFRPQAPSFDQNKNQFDSLNAKLDRIITLLEPKIATPVVTVPAIEKAAEEVKEIKAPKAKKAAKKVTSAKKK